MSKRNTNGGPGFSNFGFSTILLAFVMICIVTISALSLITANSDYKLSKKVAEKNSAYYLAEEKAYDILQEVDQALLQSYINSDNERDYYKNVENNLQLLGYGIYEKSTSKCTYSYELPITEGQSLQVVLLIQYPAHNQDSFYLIETWNSTYDVIIHEEENLNLLQ